MTNRKTSGPRAQMWCHTPLTHWMCTGYRFELLDGAKVESTCTCTCHQSGMSGIKGTSHAANMVDDPERFERARVVGWEMGKRDTTSS
jgi:hypothetical protein